jgi:hypothetical protein
LKNIVAVTSTVEDRGDAELPAREHERRHPFLLSGWQPLGDRLLREVLISCHAIS